MKILLLVNIFFIVFRTQSYFILNVFYASVKHFAKAIALCLNGALVINLPEELMLH